MLEVRGLTLRAGDGRPVLDDISLTIHAGEVLGVAGVEGNGQAELVDAIMGLRPATGTVRLGDRELTGLNTRHRREAGIGFIPEDRQRQGLLLEAPLWENRILGHQSQRPNVTGPWIDRAGARADTERIVREYDVRTPGIDVPASALSGGNQQKLIVGREMSGEPVLLLAAHPTRGVDVGAQAQIWDALRTARAAGLAVLLISADLDELIGLSDTIQVILRGRMVGTADPRTVTPEELGSAMTGAGETDAAGPDGGGPDRDAGPAGGRHAAGAVAAADSEAPVGTPPAVTRWRRTRGRGRIPTSTRRCRGPRVRAHRHRHDRLGRPGERSRRRRGGAAVKRFDLERIGLGLAAPVLALIVALLLSSVALVISGNSPLHTFNAMLDYGSQPRRSSRRSTRRRSTTCPRLAVAIGFRMNLFNIGVDGQYQIAAFFAAVVGGWLMLPGPLLIIVVVLVAVVVGALWAGIAALLKVTRGRQRGHLDDHAQRHRRRHRRLPARPEPARHARSAASRSTTEPMPADACLPGIPVSGGRDLRLRRRRDRLRRRVLGAARPDPVRLRPAGHRPVRDRRGGQRGGLDAQDGHPDDAASPAGSPGWSACRCCSASSHAYAQDFPTGYGFAGIAIALLGRNSPDRHRDRRAALVVPGTVGPDPRPRGRPEGDRDDHAGRHGAVRRHRVRAGPPVLAGAAAAPGRRRAAAAAAPATGEGSPA